MKEENVYLILIITALFLGGFFGYEAGYAGGQNDTLHGKFKYQYVTNSVVTFQHK